MPLQSQEIGTENAILLLSGPDSLANYELALESVAFQNSDFHTFNSERETLGSSMTETTPPLLFIPQS